MLMQSHDLVIPGFARRAALLFVTLLDGSAFGGPGDGIRGTQGVCGLTHLCGMARQAAFQPFSGVLQHVKAIGNVFGMRGAHLRACRIVASPIPANPPNFRVLLDPQRKGQWRSVREEIDHAMALSIEEDGPRRAASSAGKGIHAQHGHRRHCRCWTVDEQPSNGLLRDLDAERRSQGFRATTSRDHSQRGDCFHTTQRLACPRTHILCESFGKDLRRHERIAATERADLQGDGDLATRARGIGNRAPVGPVNLAGRKSTPWTWTVRSLGTDVECHAGIVRRDGAKAKSFWLSQEGQEVHAILTRMVPATCHLSPVSRSSLLSC